MFRINREDEQDVDFSDTTGFVLKRWEEAVDTAVRSLTSPADRKAIKDPRDWQTLYADIQRRAGDASALPVTRRLLSHLQPLPRTFANLIATFIRSISPQDADFTVLYGLVDMNIKLSISTTSTEKLGRTAGWLKKMRSVVELFNRCLNVCEDYNEARLAMADVLDCILNILVDSIRHLRNCPTDTEASREWKGLESKINDNLAEMEGVVKHLNEITSYSMVNLERQVKHLSLRHAPVPQPEEHATFPIMMLPHAQNDKFYGRQEELERINQYLDYRGNKQLRTYTIYGRRGVGKTDIALQYAYTNPSGFEAIFWVQCETSLSLRQTFTDIAVALNLPGADRNGHHEENQLAVLKWLKTTNRQWLLIFDNAERESILKSYWPVGANGAILITSRKYYNFMKDNKRKGDTVKPFNDKQSWDLLIKLLGDDWEDLDKKGLIKVSEEQAAKAMLKSIGGLALAIQQAATLIKDHNIGGPTIASTLELFKEKAKDLPLRPTGARSDIIHSLDTLWNMKFTHLSRNARDFLSVISLLSPDGILIDLFLPRNQSALSGKLGFCKQPANLVDDRSQAALSSIVNPPPALRAAIDELVNAQLIRQGGREIWVHRVVQEAMNYHSSEELQESFDSASRLVYEAFPKQLHDNYIQDRSACQSYISHGAHLSLLFSPLVAPNIIIKGSQYFIDLLSNCAWYLYEVSDYDMCLRVVETAWSACEDKSSLRYATLCNIAGGAYYELNKLGECRKNWEKMMEIRDAKLSEDDLERSTSYHVMGNLESACGNLEEAMDYFNRAVSLRLAAGDTGASLLATTYICIARVHFLKDEYAEAYRMTAQSEALFVRTAGAGNHFLANVHYLYGNIEFAQKKWIQALRCYNDSLRIGLANAPVHPITAAAYYSLGCVEFEMKHHDNARAFLDKAMAIAQLRSPTRDDGTMARIMWKMSKVMEDDVYGTYAKTAEELRIRAEVAQKLLTGNGEGGVIIAIDDKGNLDAAEEEDSYDALVPGYFR